MADVYKAVLARLNERTLAIHSNAALHQELQQATIELLELKSVLARVREVQSAGVQLAQGEQIVNTTPRFQDVVIDIHTLQQQLTSKMRRLAGPQAPQSPVISHEAEAVVAEDSGVPAQAIDLCVESSDNEETAPVTQGSDGRGNEAFPIALNLREKRTLGSISKKIEMLMTSCLDQKQQQQQTKQSRGTRFRCVILSFERIIIQALGSRNERIQNAVAAHPDLRTSIQILMKQIVSLKSKVLSAVAAEMMLKTIALVPVKSKALHSALHRYQTRLADHVKKTHKPIKTSIDPETCCQSALEFVQDLRQKPFTKQENQIRPILDRLQNALELCEFSGWHTNKDQAGVQMKTLSCAFGIIVDILASCSTTKIVSRKTAIQNLYDDVDASYPAFHRLVKSSMKRLQELLHQVQVPDRALEITNLSSTSSERSHPLRESVRTALVSTSKWRSDRFKLERFDEIMDSLTAVMQYSDRDWDPRVDIEVRKCVLQMQKRSVWITQDDERQARQLILDDWLASLTE